MSEKTVLENLALSERLGRLKERRKDWQTRSRVTQNQAVDWLETKCRLSELTLKQMFAPLSRMSAEGVRCEKEKTVLALMTQLTEAEADAIILEQKQLIKDGEQLQTEVRNLGLLVASKETTL